MLLVLNKRQGIGSGRKLCLGGKVLLFACEARAKLLGPAHLIEVQRSLVALKGATAVDACLELRNGGKCAQWLILVAILGSF